MSGCWIWLGRQYQGYGRINTKRSNGKWGTTTAQRHFFETYRRELLPSEDAAHRCHRRSCCNPRHLKAATRTENVADWHVDQQFDKARKEEVAQMLAADLPVSVIADLMYCPRPYIWRLVEELDWQKYQTSFDFEDTAS